MADKKKTIEPRQVPFMLHGLFGGTAGALGICVVQPADLIKTRMQLAGQVNKKTSVIGVFRDVITKEGYLAMYNGLSCSILRQYTYGLTRFMIFYNLYEDYKRKYGVPPNPGSKIGMGMLAGAVGAVAGTPADIALIRMTADGNLPPEKKRNYKHVFNALYRISKEEGVLTLWRGVEATVTRAMIVTGAELGSYAEAREFLAHYLEEGIGLHFSASMVAGLVATIVSLPVDIIKTRVQNSKEGLGQVAVLKKIMKNEGIATLWTGFLPTYAKLGPHSVLTFVIFEQFYILYWKIVDSRATPSI